MAGVREGGAARGLRARLAGCSVKAAFALYAAGALAAALVLSIVSSGVFGLLAQTTLSDDPYAYSGTFVFDEGSNSLVPAETLSWYELSAFDSLYEQGGTEMGADGESLGASAVFLYVEGSARGDAKPISLDDPPAGVPDGTVVDVSWTASVSDVYDESLSFSEIAAYDAAERPARPGFEAALALTEQLPENADGEKPIVSNVGYYVPYPGDSVAYRMTAWAFVASVPVIFVVCLVVAGRRFYRTRIAGPVAAMDSAAQRIAAGDLDFEMAPQRGDELGRLCARFEEMRSELARAKAETWRAAESRRRVNAAFAHDLRTPLTVIRGRSELIGMVSDDDRVVSAASAISRQAERLAAYADSMSGLDSLEDASVRPVPVACETLLERIREDARSVAEEYGASLSVSSRGLPPVVEADAAAVLRVADNLASNAARHAASAMEIELAWEDGNLSLSVADDGSGFGDAAARALEPFWRGVKDRAASAGGSDGHMGLGLYVCSVLCARHGGSIEVGDRKGGGAIATATFSAPAVPADSADNGSEDDASEEILYR